MRIDIQSIPHGNQRYETVGDYWEEEMLGGKVIRHIRVSDMGNEDYEFLVALHEMVESFLCKKRGISEESITEFDMEFEKNRPEGNTDEPGNDQNAPYKKEHQFATRVEKMMAEELGVDWNEYDNAVINL